MRIMWQRLFRKSRSLYPWAGAQRDHISQPLLQGLSSDPWSMSDEPRAVCGKAGDT